MKRPSIFRHAPGELSQDAFLAWLLEWADPSLRDAEPALHRAGRDFLESLLHCAGHPIPATYESVRVELQLQKIDLLVVVDEKLAVVIEDKVHTAAHGDQLERYRIAVQLALDIPLERTAFVYLKTGDECDTRHVSESGYAYYRRAQLLRVLEQGLENGVDNNIYTDFTEHIRGMERRVNAWATLPINRWGSHDPLWIGLFDELQDRLKAGGWGMGVGQQPRRRILRILVGRWGCAGWLGLPAGRLMAQAQCSSLDKAGRGQEGDACPMAGEARRARPRNRLSLPASKAA